MLQKYGYSNNFQNLENVEKIKQSKIKHYGSLEESYKEQTRKTKQTKKERYGDEYYVNKDKRRQTCLEKYGVENPFMSKEIQEKGHQNKDYEQTEQTRKRTCLEKYGTTSFCDRNHYNKKIIEKYGSLENFYKIRQEKVEQSNLKYGIKSTFQLDSTMRKAEQTKKERYGSEYAFNRLLYLYDNITFDSSWELAYYIWLTDNKIDFVYKPAAIQYQMNGRTHFYYPDFLIDGTYYEIKGNHLITEAGDIINPYTKIVLKEKSQLMKDLKVKILKAEEIDPILKYVSQTYGPGYLKQFKKVRKNGNI
jgi:hypothetical protein